MAVTPRIRTVALLGAVGSGKTTLTEALLHRAGVLTRTGRVEDGSTVSDHEPEEIAARHLPGPGVAPFPWTAPTRSSFDVTLLDTPGSADFAASVDAGAGRGGPGARRGERGRRRPGGHARGVAAGGRGRGAAHGRRHQGGQGAGRLPPRAGGPAGGVRRRAGPARAAARARRPHSRASPTCSPRRASRTTPRADTTRRRSRRVLPTRSTGCTTRSPRRSSPTTTTSWSGTCRATCRRRRS